MMNFSQLRFYSSALLAAALLWLVPALPAYAACSTHVGKVVFNELNQPTSGTNFIEIKVLDPAVIAATSNFQNWKIAVYAGNSSTSQTTDVSSGFTNAGVNSCGQQSLWIRFPDSVLSFLSTHVPPFNFILYDTSSGGQIIDIMRVGSTLTSFYGAGSNYNSCSTIESQLPTTGTTDTQYDALAPTTGASVKDWYRVPDGTGPWIGSATANTYNTVCGSNDGGTNPYFGVAKSPAVTTVATNTNFDYTLYATNGATAVSSPASVVITDNLTAAGLTFVSCTAAPGTVSGTSSGPTGTCTYSAGTVTWTVGAMAANKVYKVTLTVKAASPGVVTNTIVSNVNSPVVSATNAGVTVTGAGGPDHVELVHDGAGLTCTPKAITVLGCTTAASCNGVSANQYSGSFSIALTAIAGAQWCTDGTCATTLTSPATVTSGTVIYLKDTNVRTDRMAGTSSSASNTTIQCTNTSTPAFNATTACDVSVAASGFLVTFPDHVSCTNSTLTVKAVQSSNNATNCVPMFRNQSRAETISLSYTSPATGTLVPTVGGTAISTGGTSVTLAYDNTGIATPAFVYQDAGSLTITVTDPSLPMTGSGTGIIAPASFVFSGIPAAPLTAGQAFNATVTAMNACATPAVTPNFQSSSVALTSSNPVPGLGNATAINTTASAFSMGVSSTNLTWNEVGTIDLAANLANYLGASPALPVSGAIAGVGRFKPGYFDVVVTPGCSGSFTYAGLNVTGPPAYQLAGQSFTVQVKAKRTGGDATDATNTANYDGATWAKAVTLSDANAGTGTLTNGSLANTAFVSGIGSRNDVSYAFGNKLTAPYTLAIRAIDTDSVSSSGHAEGSTSMRSGRLRLSNAFGSEKSPLAMAVQAHYWTGQSWLLNSGDSCTSVPSNAFYLLPVSPCSAVPAGVAAAAVTLAGGTGTLSLSKPSPATTCSLDVAANLGTSGSDQSCLSAHGGTAASLSWLRSQNGNCAATYDRDPSARASFGIYSPETRKTIHVREQY